VIKTALKFGAFVGVCLAFTLWLAFTIGNIRLFEDKYDLSASFDDVTGLLVNDNVKVAGVVVGKVTKIEVDRGQAIVRFNVRDDVRVPSDTRAVMRWRNLLGQRYLYLEPGEASTTLQDGDVVRETESVVQLGQLFNRLGPIVAAIDPQKVNTFLDAITEALDGNQDSLRAAIDDLALLARELGERDEQIGRLIENLNSVAGTIASREQQISVMLDNLVLISQTFSENTEVLDAAMTEMGDFADDFGYLLESNRGQIDRLMGNLVEVIRVVRSKLDTLDRAVPRLDDAAARLFNSSRYGEWLNQVIPCAADHPPENPEEPCARDASGLPAAAPASAPAAEARTNVDAVATLMGIPR
jgi:phospholipid/cholesterol/gamma-HCH transport system substrate-binding protein